ncbi:type II toxin-antitoxin system ParD family antitoxin [Bosea sp. CS1GBMeth4]|uniref:type II toxin-antitoxin system ParD family antitoxin n=1 Tax=Bosea sp. CS1GBMeth4 TaxID=1892849 RepID=UPI001645B671|nr:type II toxin-antitoxin system ParD family antitoxin [Bosea sp. CS1GBMeth4]
MNVSIGPRWENFIADIVEAGRYGSASEVVREGLRLVEEREAKLQALRDMVEESIARGGSHTDEDVSAAIETALDEIDRTEASR